MRKTLIWALFALFSSIFVFTAFADTYVRGYTKRNGTYVAPHYRSSPDKSYNNNWSVKPNVNPYTGRQGTRRPAYNDRSPAYNPLRSRQQRRSSYPPYR